LKNQPQHARALAYLGDVEMRLEHEQSATELLQRALAVDSNLRLAHLDLGILLAGKKDSSGAARHFREAIRIDPSKPDAHYRLGRLLSALDRDEEAQAEFEQVKKLAAEEPPPPLIRLSGRKLP
jgi:tetratricopeptide (TPR) repeat protein